MFCRRVCFETDRNFTRCLSFHLGIMTVSPDPCWISTRRWKEIAASSLRLIVFVMDWWDGVCHEHRRQYPQQDLPGPFCLWRHAVAGVRLDVRRHRNTRWLMSSSAERRDRC